METSGSLIDLYTTFTSEAATSNSNTTSSFNSALQFPSVSMFQSPISFLLEITGIIPTLPSTPQYQTNQNFIVNGTYTQTQLPDSASNHGTSNNSDTGEVSIQIIETGGHDLIRQGSDEQNGETLDIDADNGDTADERLALASSPALTPHLDSTHLVGDVFLDGPDSSFQDIEMQHIARWAEQILPFILLLLVVFIRQHLQGSDGFQVSATNLL